MCSMLFLLLLFAVPIRYSHSQSYVSTLVCPQHPPFSPTNFMSSFFTPISLLFCLSCLATPFAASTSTNITPPSSAPSWPSPPVTHSSTSLPFVHTQAFCLRIAFSSFKSKHPPLQGTEHNFHKHHCPQRLLYDFICQPVQQHSKQEGTQSWFLM